MLIRKWSRHIIPKMTKSCSRDLETSTSVENQKPIFFLDRCKYSSTLYRESKRPIAHKTFQIQVVVRENCWTNKGCWGYYILYSLIRKNICIGLLGFLLGRYVILKKIWQTLFNQYLSEEYQK